MRALAAESSQPLRLSGIGGPQMQDAGLRSLFPADDIAVMGIAEVLPKVLRVMRRLRMAEWSVRALRPDAVVTIDAPGFNFRLAARLRNAGIPLIHYVAPTVWAWKPGRARKVAGFLDHILTLFPFEPAYFERVGLPATFVGHPIVETPRPGPGMDFWRASGIERSARVLLVLPGSRAGEVARLAPRFAGAARILRSRHHDLRIVVGVAPGRRAAIAKAFAGLEPVLVDDETTKRFWYGAADVALAASGTVTLEVAHAGTAMVVAYRMAPLTWEVVRRTVTIKHANVLNLLHGAAAIPELLQRACRPEKLADAVDTLLCDADARARQIRTASAMLAKLRAGALPPSREAARAILATLASADASPEEDPQ